MNQRCPVCDYHPRFESIFRSGTTEEGQQRHFVPYRRQMICHICYEAIRDCRPYDPTLDEVGLIPGTEPEYLVDPDWDTYGEIPLPKPEPGVEDG